MKIRIALHLISQREISICRSSFSDIWISSHCARGYCVLWYTQILLTCGVWAGVVELLYRWGFMSIKTYFDWCFFPLFFFFFPCWVSSSINSHLLLLLVNIKHEKILEFVGGRNTIVICDFAFAKWCQTTGIRKRLSESRTNCCRTTLL